MCRDKEAKNMGEDKEVVKKKRKNRHKKDSDGKESG